MPAFTNAKQNIPELFKEIMRLHDEIDQVREEMFAATCDYVVAVQHNQVREYKRLKEERLKPLLERLAVLRRAAEKVLCWNVDKGNTA